MYLAWLDYFYNHLILIFQPGNKEAIFREFSLSIKTHNRDLLQSYGKFLELASNHLEIDLIDK